MLVRVAPPAPQAVSSRPSAAAQPPAAASDQRQTVVASAAPIVDIKAATPQPQAAPPKPAAVVATSPASPTPATVIAAPPAPAKPAAVVAAPAQIATAQIARAQVEALPVEPDRAEVAEVERINSAIPSEPVHAHGGWLIQIGAFDDENDAKQHLSDAQLKMHAALAAKDPFTERIQKGDKAMYRARFAGFDKTTADATCKQLKRNDFDCITVKN